MCSAGELKEHHLQKLNAENIWKTKLINRYKRNTEPESHKTKVDKGVHPLHWATSLGPSPLGTDPINLLKMVQNGSGNNFSNYKQNALQIL